MLEYAEPVARLIDELKRLPGVGQKSAQRIAFYLLQARREDVEQLVSAIREVKEKIGLCSSCNNVTDIDPCKYCRSSVRDRRVICVVEEPHNLVTIEKTREYNGLYHVLHGALSPIRGIGPEDLKIKNLLERLRSTEVEEVILATNPTTEGEATANYLNRLLKPLGIKITRIGMGLPVGSDIEYADEVTMHRALANRREM
ncbi:MAG: recombination mediator RecR [Acidobacteriota bacterium]|nr:recombination mediator RecR [Blastocatellia bacterium]MDW8412730.1 recombination mediator RecR [Acidobacteriota bacterium]